MKYKRSIVVISPDLRLAERTGERLAHGSGAMFASGRKYLEYMLAGSDPDTAARRAGRDYVIKTASACVKALAELDSAVIALPAEYVDERSMAAVSAGGYVIAADMPLAAAADKLVSSEHSRAVKLSKRAATEKWKLVRANADYLIKNVSRCDSFASRVIDWIEENVQ